MTFISYAQNYEDVMLWRALKHVKNGFYIDVGAAWPDLHSVTRGFYTLGWRGINIEPNPKFFEMLEKDRPEDINLAVAAGEKSGEISMNFIEDTGLSTASEKVADIHSHSGLKILKTEIQLETLFDICRKYIGEKKEIHFLKVDVEGLEKAVLTGNDWTIYRPWVVVVEATMPLSQVDSYGEWEPILLNANYKYVYADGLNRFYISNEHEELQKAFCFPPNVFDNFVLATQSPKEAQIRQAEVRAKEAQVRADQAEKKARDAEESVKNYALTLEMVYASKSWRVTSVLRWALIQRKRIKIKQDALSARIKVFPMLILRKIGSLIFRYPYTRKALVICAHKLNISSVMKKLQNIIYDKDEFAKSDNKKIELDEMSMGAKILYYDLKNAVKRRNAEDL